MRRRRRLTTSQLNDSLLYFSRVSELRCTYCLKRLSLLKQPIAVQPETDAVTLTLYVPVLRPQTRLQQVIVSSIRQDMQRLRPSKPFCVGLSVEEKAGSVRIGRRCRCQPGYRDLGVRRTTTGPMVLPSERWMYRKIAAQLRCYRESTASDIGQATWIHCQGRATPGSQPTNVRRN